MEDIYSDGAWFRLTDGRYALLRGICFGPSAKEPPHTPLRSREDWPRFETYVDLLWACGWRVLRLAFIWSALEPTCNPESPEYDESYMASFFEYVDLLIEKGFLIILDLHQDLVGKAYGGSGMPDWVRSDKAADQTLLPNTALWGLNYLFNRHLRRTFTDFWSNDLTNSAVTPPLVHFAVRDRYLDMVERVAEEAATRPGVFGIEIFNEPHPATIESREFEEEILPKFYEGATERIRRHSQQTFALLAPQSDWNVNVGGKEQESYLRMASRDHRAVFAYHYYDSLLTGFGGYIFHDSKRDEYVAAQRAGVASARSKGMAPFLTEFGARQNWMRPVVRRQMNWQYEAIEQALVSATYWNVNLYNTPETFDGFMREDFSLLGVNQEPRNLDIACRPYVMAASAEPVHMQFNIRSKEFELLLRGRPMAGPTVIYVPVEKLHPLQPVHYPGGFELEYSGRHSQSMILNELSITLDPELDMHRIFIRPKS
ncbi:MAG: cellulase family glycosylhydrolase [Bacteroidota bacterium]|nr:cellulase family glycosylhydrolase [Bacteroidota bacterium]